MTTITARTILRSRNTSRPDLVKSSLLLRYPWNIHAELLTHRVFSKNSASSRAIPVKKLIEDVRADPYVPLVWGKNCAGMQSFEELPAHLANKAYGIWMRSMEDAIYNARRLANLAEDEEGKGIGAHKQVVNALLKPFAHITVFLSGTAFSNFLAVRRHKDAEPHMQMLASEVGREVEANDNIQDLAPGNWHLPWITEQERGQPAERLIPLSMARAASTSYKTVDGFDMDQERASALHDKLVAAEPLHASPAEHVSLADEWVLDHSDEGGFWLNEQEHANTPGFRQYRKMLPGECL